MVRIRLVKGATEPPEGETMAKEAKTARSRGQRMPTTPFVNLSGRDVPVKELTPDQLQSWRELRSAEQEHNIWEDPHPCVMLQ